MTSWNWKEQGYIAQYETQPSRNYENQVVEHKTRKSDLVNENEMVMKHVLRRIKCLQVSMRNGKLERWIFCSK